MRMAECPEACAVSPTGQVAAPGVLNALTIDVEDYYQVASFESRVSRADWHRLESRVRASTEVLLKTLEDAGVRGTFFVLGWVAQQQPRLVQEIYEAGHEIGCHSYWHRLVYRQTAEDFREDLRRARDVLQETTGDAVVAYRAPCFSITRRSLWALDVLIEEGFVIDSSIFPTFHDRYGIAGAPAAPHWIGRPAGAIREFPLAVYRLCGYPLPIGGGGYFRLYPYMFTRRGLRAINAEGRPVAVYLHPWEVDPEQPRLAWGGLNAFRHYVNLRHTQDRLRRLLADFPLGTLSDAFAHVEATGRLATWDLRLAAA
jgi:polysaccharide deacetylase family protein (PEP-CTERM system associated)